MSTCHDHLILFFEKVCSEFVHLLFFEKELFLYVLCCLLDKHFETSFAISLDSATFKIQSIIFVEFDFETEDELVLYAPNDGNTFGSIFI